MYPMEIRYSHIYIIFALILSPIRKLGTVYESNNISVAFPLAFGKHKLGLWNQLSCGEHLTPFDRWYLPQYNAEISDSLKDHDNM